MRGSLTLTGARCSAFNQVPYCPLKMVSLDCLWTATLSLDTHHDGSLSLSRASNSSGLI
jgi:hypothetical protein